MTDALLHRIIEKLDCIQTAVQWIGILITFAVVGVILYLAGLR